MGVYNLQHTGISRFQYTTFKNKLKIKIPPLPIQKKIAAVLSAYDDLIENNNRRIAILEKTAEEIYREWFVRMRFPGHETTAFKKGVPEEWEIIKLNDVINDIIDYRGLTPLKLNSNWSNDGIIALSALNVKGGSLIKLNQSKKVSDNLYNEWMKKKLEKFDILLTSEAPLGELYLLMEKEKYVLSQRLFAIRANQNRINPIYLFCYLCSQIGQHELKSKATGATVSGIRQKLLREIDIIVPNNITQEKFSKIVSALYRNKNILWKKNKTLKQTRDRLLPRLLSGKLSVENLDIKFPPGMEDTDDS